jgi:hypothetical protein
MDKLPVRVPVQWRGLEDPVVTRGATRGFLGGVMLKAIDVVTGKVFVSKPICSRFSQQRWTARNRFVKNLNIPCMTG